MSHADLLAAIWDAIPEGAEPESFAARRAWLLERVAAGATVLDLGCGAGEVGAALREHGGGGAAVDAAARTVRRAGDAQLVAPEAPLPFGDGSFDVAWLGETLEHLVDPVGTLHEGRRVLRPRGAFLATTPDHPPDLLRALAGDAARFAEHFSPRTDHLRFFNATSLQRLLTDLGFQDLQIDA